MINYLLELYPAVGNSNPIGVRCSWSGYVEIYVIKLERYTSTYWTDWGGYYDNPESTKLSITYDGVVLTEVSSKANLIATTNSFYISGTSCYINLALYNYYSKQSLISISQAEYYTTSVIDKANPSYPYLNGSKYKTILDIPSCNQKLSDDFSGMILQQSFNATLNNLDGSFDDAGNDSIKRYFNAVAILKRTDKNNPTYTTDWTTILSGTIDDFTTDFDKINFSISDKLKSFDQPVCDLVNLTDYPNAPDSSIGKKIPIAFNEIYQADVIQVDDTAFAEQYIFVKSTYYTALNYVYDSDGNILVAGAGNDYTINASGVIQMLATASAQPAKVDFAGKTQNLGAMITTEISNHAGIAYNSTNWDNTETNVYIAGCPSPGLVFFGNDLKSFISECLKNDTIFLISIPSGKLTIRHFWNDDIYTPDFTNHALNTWVITQKPNKRFVDSQYWMTSVLVTGVQNRTVLNEDYETISAAIYSKSKQKEYTCSLYYTTPFLDELANLAEHIIKRFYKRREIIEFALGSSVLTFKLLDTITIDLDINGRRFSKKTAWKITGIDYAQDKITMEEI